jgi:hypothetical protein
VYRPADVLSTRDPAEHGIHKTRLVLAMDFGEVNAS